VIAAPLAYYMMHNWLQNYEYRTAINLWVFILSGVVAMLITVLSVSYQAIKSASKNPIKSLRNE
jgi:putative ABC transport system permease protein